MAANEMIVKRYEMAVEEIESNQQVLSDVILDGIKRLREEFRESGRNDTDINRTIISKLQLEMYLDICRQLDEIKELIANK